jgi:hypothetical protein
MELHASRNRNLPETFHVSFCEDAMGRAAKVRHLWRSEQTDGAESCSAPGTL